MYMYTYLSLVNMEEARQQGCNIPALLVEAATISVIRVTSDSVAVVVVSSTIIYKRC